MNTETGCEIVGRASGFHLEIRAVSDGGMQVALCNGDLLKAIALLGPSENDGGYFVNSFDSYHRHDNQIDVRMRISKAEPGSPSDELLLPLRQSQGPEMGSASPTLSRTPTSGLPRSPGT